jgi:steroid delta-isomerase-like uncharacterized protein
MLTELPERNAAVVRRYVDAFNRGDLAAVAALFAPDAVVYGVQGQGGLDDYAVPLWTRLRAAFPDLRLTLEGLLAEGDAVAARYTERGTLTGPFQGAAPTGRAYAITAMEWFRIVDGRIRERWAVRDAAAILRQVGLGPAA